MPQSESRHADRAAFGGIDPVEVLERVQTPRGELVLRRAGAHHEVISNGVFLMDTRGGASERLLVRAALDALDAAPGTAALVIGGLGVGFSLDEALRHPATAQVTVVEVEPALVRWHRTFLAERSGRALADPRVAVVEADLLDWLRNGAAAVDAICIDIDNGPEWTVTDGNARLYDDAGTALVRRRLRSGGALSVWSAAAAPAYEQLLGRHFAGVEVLPVPVLRGEPDVVYLARA